ncbi:MAG TPA: SCO family protein [Pyrinomonadaceae bacterium]|nr:SCO family protein [Pyrinomonadaceae bacterium]
MLASLCAGFASCSRPKGEERRYDLKGKIVSVEREKGQINVDHEEIPGFMAAMVMPFPIKDKDVLGAMQPGDTLQATLVVGDEGYWLENIAVTKALPGAEAAAAAAGAEPRPGAEMPDFKLVNQDGRTVRARDLRGRAVLVTFIYTRCPLPDQCPLMSANFADVSRELSKDEALGSKARLLSVTLDPEFDTPEVLARYAERYGTAGSYGRWDFLTGDPAEVRRLAEFFGLMYKAEDGQVIHSLRTAVVGPDGKLYKVYRGNGWKPEEALKDLRGLVQ